LLTEDPNKTLVATGFDPTLTKYDLNSLTQYHSGPDSTKPAMALGVLCNFDVLPGVAEGCARNTAIVTRSAVLQGMTGFDGKLQLADLQPGTYYLFGSTPTRSRRGIAMWSIPVVVKSGQNTTVTLDANNAAWTG
jgi:hypothetical protein